jgi:hypothetical protein
MFGWLPQGADVVGAVVLEVAEEAEDPLEAQAFDAELGELRLLVFATKHSRSRMVSR